MTSLLHVECQWRGAAEVRRLAAVALQRVRPERNQMKNRIVHISRRANTAATLFVAFASLVAFDAAADAVATFQSGAAAPFGGGVYAGCQDTMLVNNNGSGTDQNFGGRSDFEVGESPNFTSFSRHSLIRFDVTSFAGQFQSISNVTLRLYVTVASLVETGDTLQVFRLTPANSDWVEGSGVAFNTSDPADVGMSTWAQKVQGSANWAGSAGASTPGVDYISQPLATFSYASTNVAVGTYIDLVFTNTSFLKGSVNEIV
jgi:hypothetical protein